MKSSLSQDLGQKLFHERLLVPSYTNRQDSVELFSCPPIPKNPETLSRYQRSIPIHLLESTVDIDSQCRLKSHIFENTVDIASTVDFRKKIGWNRPSIWIHTQKKLVDRVFSTMRKQGPLTYGSIGGEKLSFTQIHQQVMVPCLVRNDPKTYSNIDTYPPIHRPSRSVTVNIEGQCRFTDRRIKSISMVDADSSTENYGRSLIVD